MGSSAGRGAFGQEFGSSLSSAEQVRAASDTVEVIAQYVQLKKSGANFKGLCPFHQERTPSFWVNPAKQLFYCFGCGAGGDVFSFVMKMESLSFVDALHVLAKRAGIEIRQHEKPSAAWREKDELYKVHGFAARLFQEYFSSAPRAEGIRKYVEGRGLQRGSLDQFQMGYAPSERDFFLEAAMKEGYSQSLLLKSGLVIQREDGGLYDRFRDRLMFAIHDGQGRIVAFGGRAMGDVQPKYLNSPETPIFQKGQHLFGWPFARSAVAKHGSIVVVEGYMDCIVLHQMGIANVVATLGTALTSTQASMMKRYTDTCFLAFDVDVAGIQASGRGAEALIEQGLLVKIVPLPTGKDPDEFVLEVGVSGWAQSIAEAPNFFETVVPHEVKTLDQKLEVVRRIIPLLAKVHNEIEKAEYVKWIAARIRTEERFLWKEIRQVKVSDPLQKISAGVVKGAANKSRSHESTILDTERQMLKLLLEDVEFAREVKEGVGSSGFTVEAHRRLADRCFELMEQSLTTSIENMRSMGTPSEEDMQVLSRLEFVEYPPLSPEKMKEEFLKIFAHRVTRQRWETAKQRIEDLKKAGKTIPSEVLEEWSQVSRQLKGSR